MDYLYENLGHERFQEFCSSLIAKEFSDVQSFPVGQPDGGRDSIAYISNGNKRDFIVFQVKYARNPNVPDLHKWLVETIDLEIEKIKQLIPRGAIKYYLITNVRGTAHLDGGSKDKLTKILEEHIEIPSLCWWRDDISRLIEKDSIFRWSFPEILNGQDILNNVLFQNINENKDRREAVVRAYLTDQYTIDNEVKFRQIDLQNKLFDLFTDVPLRVKKFNEKNKSLRKIFSHFESKITTLDNQFFLDPQEDYGAASFLLHPKIQLEVERLLIEGGPGQGKSTIVQYICQVHRARLLNKLDDIKKLPDEIKNSPVRFPIKIDLRHVAAWVEKKNPYQGRFNEEYFTSIWKNSLESFLIGHIVYHSNIDEFSSGDLLAIVKFSSVLLVFDGFDEIADLKIRQDVIDFINKGINRLSENTKSIQVVITSRPAAFSDSIGFSIDTYPHFELTDITPKIISQYVQNWIKASRLDDREAKELKRLVDEKIQMPHLRDLAKSPMQLAIFISLLRTRGESLPNKRTALYDSYIDLFFNRESEKNTTIRDNRDLIIDIHQYLAWVLHSEAEQYNNSGSIELEILKKRLKIYLENEGHDPSIADNLFHVMEERVCALVSRIQGTYEFEVQPLREYFCAKYLYNTSPYSPAGAEKKGTKPERFDAISRNFYWHNVVRFFAGCFDKGELPLLIQKLKELHTDELLRYTNYPRLLTSKILSDWVFTQYPILLKDAIKIILDGINIGSIINQESYYNNTEPILLPTTCGRDELVDECFKELEKIPKFGFALELIGLIKNNPIEILSKWLFKYTRFKDKNLTTWLEYGYQLGIIYKVDNEILLSIIKEGDIVAKRKRIQIIINGNKQDILEIDSEIKEFTFQAILNSKIFLLPTHKTNYSLTFLSTILHPILLKSAMESENKRVTFLESIMSLFRIYSDQHQQLLKQFEISDKIDSKIDFFLKNCESIFDTDVKEWKNSLQHWDKLVENLRLFFGDNLGTYQMATIAAGIKSKEEIYSEYDCLSDDTKSLCKRIRCARMKSGNVNFWHEQLQEETNIFLTLLVLFVWATPKTISSLIGVIWEKVQNLSDDTFQTLSESIPKSLNQNTYTNPQYNYILELITENDVPDKIKYLLSLRMTEDTKHKFIYDHINTSNFIFEDVQNNNLRYLINLYLKNTKDIDLLKKIQEIYLYSEGFQEEQFRYRRLVYEGMDEIPIDIARKIMMDSKNYPRSIASLAEKTCKLYANTNTIAVGKIALEQNWFELM